MTFEEHGTFDIKVTSNVIAISLYGAFNKEATQHYCNDVALKVSKLASTPFYILLDIRRVEGATPDSWDVAQQHNNWLATQNLVKKVIVCSNESVEYFAHKINESTLSGKVIYFHELGAAQQWIESNR